MFSTTTNFTNSVFAAVAALAVSAACIAMTVGPVLPIA